MHDISLYFNTSAHIELVGVSIILGMELTLIEHSAQLEGMLGEGPIRQGRERGSGPTANRGPRCPYRLLITCDHKATRNTPTNTHLNQSLFVHITLPVETFKSMAAPPEKTLKDLNGNWVMVRRFAAFPLPLAHDRTE